MRIFITGATGFIGEAVARACARGGHETFGLARDEKKASALAAVEIVPVIGAVENPEGWRAEAERAEVLIHCAVDYSGDPAARDGQAITALLAAARAGANAGFRRSLIYTSGVWVYGDSGDAIRDESDALMPLPVVAWRPGHEKLVLAAAQGEVRPVVIRPGCVYGGHGSLTAGWFASAEKDGAAAIAGSGANRWAMVHRDDLGELYRLAAERELSGVALNAVAHHSETVAEMAAAASRAAGAGGKTAVLPEAEARRRFGPLADGLLVNQRVTSERARRLLGWIPRQPSFAAAAARWHAAWKAAQTG